MHKHIFETQVHDAWIMCNVYECNRRMNRGEKAKMAMKIGFYCSQMPKNEKLKWTLSLCERLKSVMLYICMCESAHSMRNFELIILDQICMVFK